MTTSTKEVQKKGSAITSVKKFKKEVGKEIKSPSEKNQAMVVKNPTGKKELVNSLTNSVKPRNKANLVEQVISNRAVKYLYPADIVDTLSRKAWRQKTRDELNKLKLILADIKDSDSKEYKVASKKLEAFQKANLKSEK